MARPRQGEEIKLAPLNMRTSPELRTQIEEAADASGRSLTQEVERRLISSFNEDRWMGGPHIRTVVKMLGAVIDRIEERTRKRWIDDHDTWTMVEEAAKRLLAWDRPPPPREYDGLYEMGLAADAARAARDAAQEALRAFREENGLTAAPQKRGLFAAFPPFEPVDPRADWTEGQRGEEQRLIAAVEEAEGEATRLGDALTQALTTALARTEAARQAGVEEADYWFSLLGPKPKRQAERIS